ncbi:AMP-binding protein [Heliorestis convoluta]|nr:AMP-binding protein [Heliorestis convoluta]
MDSVKEMDSQSFNFSRDILDQWAQDRNKLAMLWVDDEGREVPKTFWEIAEESKKLCNVLQNQGVGRNDVVIVILPRFIEWWIVHSACLRMGAIISPGTGQLTPKDILFRLQASEATCVITDASVAPKVDAALEEYKALQCKILVSEPGQQFSDYSAINSTWIDYHSAVAAASADFEAVDTQKDDNALLYFTSGTTGYPKMTVHTHASYPLGHEVTGKHWLDLTEKDLHWNLSDSGWAKAAWSSFFGPWICGATVFVHHSNRFHPQKTLSLLEKYPITTFCGAPTIYRMLVLEDLSKYRFQALRHCVSAGEPLNPEVIDYWKKHTDLTIRDGYGQTETVLLVGNFPSFEPRLGSMGKPSPSFDVQVIDDEGNILPPHREGDIAVRVVPERPVGLFKEYWKDPEKTAASFRGDWYLTGDRAYYDEDGYFWFVGRADDVILSAGYRIGPFEVESALLEHDAVVESAVVSSPDPLRGEVVKAFVVLKSGYDPSDELVKELQEYVKVTTAPYKYPRRIEFVSSLPKTVSGKIRRIELREQEWHKSNETAEGA